MTKIFRFFIDRIDTPIGEMLIVADEHGNLRATDWTDHEPRMQRLLSLHYGENGFRLELTRNPNGLTDAISRYFAGKFEAIDVLPVQTAGTPFQHEVWHALRRIPCGSTVSYAELAQRIGRPAAVRAVGLANGSNPVGVVVPCHRVVASDGSLSGYGGGVERKRWLLEHEKRVHRIERRGTPRFDRVVCAQPQLGQERKKIHRGSNGDGQRGIHCANAARAAATQQSWAAVQEFLLTRGG